MSAAHLPAGTEPGSACRRWRRRGAPPCACRKAVATPMPMSSPRPVRSTRRGYTPAMVTVQDYRRIMDAYGIDRAVLQPSVYGFDNSALLSALAAMPGTLRIVDEAYRRPRPA